jgi:uncharacterized RDD family membrane protein YckC
MNWFYEKDGQPAGPVDDAEFARLMVAGTIHAETLVWRSGLAEWKACAELHPTAAKVAPQPPPLPTLRVPAAASRAEPLPTDGEDLRYAGFWIRVAAGLLDGLIFLPVLSLLNIGFMFAFPPYLASYTAGAHIHTIFELVVLALFAAYETVFVARCGATPGKMVCNLRVISAGGGGRVSYARAFSRGLCEFCTLILFGAGFVLVACNRQKCALHDFLCETRVVHQP